ncbi:GIY-YIG nuclease family protein [Stenotrophomonas maltophilia]|uniref:GIY-YIG nuclease family protein n=1 Tax=Stenotrophomonas maltophilia TaxID=40324 RepID=UPI0015DE092B|nr:GIY-YIG nuclease family protein [Stenotrophomonas maltophilia]
MSGDGAARFGRSEKYQARPRHIYALLFDNGCCYVGQTTDLRRREGQHRSHAGGWQGQSFTFIQLATMTGTKAEAENHEYAWRFAAQRAGWRIYGKPPNIRVNTALRMTPLRRSIAKHCVWPGQKRGMWGWLKWVLGFGAAAGMVALFQ